MEFIFQCRIFLPFHTVHGVLKARIVKWFAIPFSSWPCFVRTLHHDLSWVAQRSMAHSFTELDKAVIHVISLLVFCNYSFHSVCLLMDKVKRLVEGLADERDWLWRNLMPIQNLMDALHIMKHSVIANSIGNTVVVITVKTVAITATVYPSLCTDIGGTGWWDGRGGCDKRLLSWYRSRWGWRRIAAVRLLGTMESQVTCGEQWWLSWVVSDIIILCYRTACPAGHRTFPLGNIILELEGQEASKTILP